MADALMGKGEYEVFILTMMSERRVMTTVGVTIDDTQVWITNVCLTSLL